VERHASLERPVHGNVTTTLARWVEVDYDGE
jgi:hypothetical protein